MKVCIVGAGAIGGFLGTRLALLDGVQVSALARGETLQALRAQGWQLHSAGQLTQAPVYSVAEHASELGEQDLVIIAVKSQALTALTPQLTPLLGPQTLILPAMNGVPWWFCQGLQQFTSPLQSIDPQGAIAAALPLQQVLACVVHASAATSAPGIVQHRFGQGLIIGEPLGGSSVRAQQVVALLSRAGFDTTLSEYIRYDIWYKLWGNLTMNPLSALTGVTMDKLLADPCTRTFCSRAMLEAAAVGAQIGCAISQTPEDRHVITAKLGAVKTSMLQDVEAGRSIELDAIVGAVREIGERVGVPTPNIDAMFGMVRVLAQARGLYPAFVHSN